MIKKVEGKKVFYTDKLKVGLPVRIRAECDVACQDKNRYGLIDIVEEKCIVILEYNHLKSEPKFKSNTYKIDKIEELEILGK